MYQILSDLKDCIQACFDPEGRCKYKFFISLGIPPAECNTIGIWLDNSQRTRSDNAECCTSTYESTVKVTITSCGKEPEVFNPASEEKEAACFLAEVCALRDCLSCGGCQIEGIGCGLVVERIEYDQSKQGAMYSATIELSFVEDCCGAIEEL